MRMLAVSLLLLLACGAHPRAPVTDSTAHEGPAAPRPTRRATCALAEAGCHDAASCQGQGLCAAAPPSSDYGCGIPPTHVERCASDAECKADEVCNAYSMGCELGHRCEPRCRADACGDDSRCGDDGRCAPRRCPDDWSCADYGDCKPPAPGEGPLQGGRDWHGCVPQSCTSDAGCPCAHCVNGACSPIPGRCIAPRG